MESTRKAKLLLVSCTSDGLGPNLVLGHCQCELRRSERGSEGLRVAATEDPHLIVAELPFPDMAGQDFVSALRKWSSTPVVVLTDPEPWGEREADLLNAGADDCLLKPFGLEEFRARLKVALKHGSRMQATTGPVKRIGPVIVDLVAETVEKDGVPIRLSGLEFRILAEMVKSPGQVITHQQILRKVWLSGDSGNIAVLRAYVSMIRRKLGDPEGKALIETIPAIGYRLVECVETLISN